MKVKLGTLRKRRRFTSDFGNGVVVTVNECRVRVRLDGARARQFTTADGATVTIKSARETDWAPGMEVEVKD